MASNAINSAPEPAAKGLPETGDIIPVLLTVNTDTVPEPELVTNAKLMAVPGDIMLVFIMPHPFSSKNASANRPEKIDQNVFGK